MTQTTFAPASDEGMTPDALELDVAQKAVVEAPDGMHVAVTGAPGTGKTTTLVELLANRVQNRGYDPDAVLALVPSRLAANRLRDRLALRIGLPTSGPLARTVNSAAFQIVQSATPTGTEQVRLLTGAEQDHILAEILAGHVLDRSGPTWPDALGPDVRALQGFRTELRELMMRCVENGTSTDELRRLARAHERPEWSAAADVIDEYGIIVDSYATAFRDSSELLAEAVQRLSEGADIDRLRLVAVDDLQEFGPGALRLLRALAARGVDIVAFGDPDVAVSTFRGSDVGAIGQLGSRIGAPATEHTLTTAYRGGRSIRALVSSVSQRIGVAGGIEHRRADATADDPRGEPPIVRIEATSPAAEYRQIARVLREHHLFRDVPWSRMSVIVRSGALVPAVSKALALAEVPTKTPVGSLSIRDALASRQLLDAAALATGTIEPTIELVESLMTGPVGGLDTVALRRLKRELRHEDIAGGGTSTPGELLVDAVGHPNGFASIDSASARRAGRFAASLARARETAAVGGSIEEVLWSLWSGSGLADSWGSAALGTGLAADEANRNLDAVMALFTAAKRYVERNPEDPAQGFLTEVFSAEVPEDSLTPQASTDAVWVGTPNSVIGTETDVVVVAHLQDGAWPNPQLRGSLLYPQLLSAVLAGLPVETLDARADVLADELRMFALSVSRAAAQVVVSATVSDDEQPSVFFRFPAIAQAPVRDAAEGQHPFTLRGITGQLRRIATHGARPGDRGQAASALARLAGQGVDGADPADWYGMAEPSTTEPLVDLTDPDAHVRVSPSKLETFEKSPLVWFIDSMAARPSGVIAGMGTVIHSAMENAGTLPAEEQTDDRLSAESLWADVDRRWAELRFDAPWIAGAQKRKARELVAALSEYLLDAKRSGSTVISAEGRFELQIGQVTLSGIIDRVEKLPDGRVRIVDLKTGRSRPSAAEIPENAQLSAYQLALGQGAIEGADGAENGGAALLFVSDGVKGRSYRLMVQEPSDDAARSAFIERLAAAGEGMAAATFPGAVDLGERDPASGFAYRIHLIEAVSE
ncbi:ATP-dependent DNA helicase [Microbacterium sp. MPKO10]|uniref:ATP-dependent helicase n=1 Tax=Microbacterium sp. MPKO10 TaxID=2989818 RepID=UPI002235A884|nr:ATP-dependent DNA helicase [Microbacterium sp. MPKO10]MCW4458105.1 ATP-dependent helicase [Microbacterium sp. MPKO10]